MKKLVLILFVLLIVAIGGATVYISSIDWNEHKSVIAKQFNEATGKQVVFAGPISFKILPTPYLSATNVKILNPSGADAAKPLIEIRDLVATLSLPRLIKGEFEIQRMELRNPQINIDLLADGRLNWQSELDPEQRRAIEESNFALNSASIGGATLNITDALHDVSIKLENLNGEVVAQSIMGPYRIEGNYTKDNVPEGFAVSLGQISDSFATTLNLVITHPTSESYVRFDGSFNLTNQVVNGNVIVEAKKLKDFWAANVKSIPFAPHYDYPLAVTSDINFTPQQLTLSNIVVKYGETQGAGNLQMPFNDGFGNGGVKPRMDIAFNFTDFDLTPFAATIRNFISEHADGQKEYSPDFDFDILADIKSVRTTYKNQQIKNFELSFDMIENILTLNSFSATAPGDTAIKMKGTISAFENEPFYSLETSLDSNDFLKMLSWLDIAPDVSTAATYRKAVGNAKLSGSLQKIQISPFQFTLDKSSVSGEAGIKRGARNDIMLILNTDMINFDNYIPAIPDEERAKPWAQRMVYRFSKLGFINNFDMQLTANMDVGIYEKMPFEKVSFQGSLLDGKLEIAKLQIGSVANAKIDVSGNVSNFGKSPTFEKLNYNVQTDNLSAFISKLELAAPQLDYKKLNTLQVTGVATGDIEKFATQTKIKFKDLDVSYSGQVDHSGEQTAYNGTLDVKHPDFTKMLSDFNMPYSPQAGSLGLFDLKTTFNGTADKFKISPLTCNIGFNTFNGNLEYELNDERAVITTDMEINKFEIERFLNKSAASDNKAVVSLKADAAAEFLDKPLWSKNKIDYDFYRTFDVDGKFKIQELNHQKGTFQNVETELALKQGNMEIKRFAADYLGGKADLTAQWQMSENPTISGKIQLSNADVNLTKIGGKTYSISNGTFNIASDFSGNAGSEYDFVSSLKANPSFDFGKIDVKGIDLKAIYADIIKRETPEGLSAFIKENLVSGSTPFDTFKGKAEINDGKLTLSETSMNTPQYKVTLSGDANLAEWDMNALFNVKYAEPQYLPDFSFSLKGPMNTPALDTDINALHNLYKTKQDKKEAEIKAAEDAMKNHMQSLAERQKKTSEALIADINENILPDIQNKRQSTFSEETAAAYAETRKKAEEVIAALTENATQAETPNASDDLLKELSNANEKATAQIEEIRSQIKSAYIADVKKNIKSLYEKIVDGHNKAKMMSFQYNSDKDSFNARLAEVVTDFKPENDGNISGWESFIEDKVNIFNNQDKQLLDEMNNIQKSEIISDIEQYKNRLQSLSDAVDADLRDMQDSIEKYKSYTEEKVKAAEDAYAAKLRNEEVQRKLEENTGSISIKKSGRTVTVRRDIEDIEKAEELTEEKEIKVIDFSKPKTQAQPAEKSNGVNVVKKGRTRVN